MLNNASEPTGLAPASSVDARIGFNLSDLFALVWQRKLTMMLVVVATVITAIVYLNGATYRYTAMLQVVPAQSDAGRVPGGASGLASLVGIDLQGSQRAAPFGLYQEAVAGHAVAEILSRDPELMRRVFASRWLASSARWRLEKTPLFKAADTIKGMLGLPVYPARPPGAEDLQRFIVANLKLEENERRSIVTMTFKHEDPALARLMLERLNATAESILRQRVLDRSTNYIGYLEAKLRTVDIAEYRLALIQLLSNQEQLRMVASSGLPYAATPFGEISVSDRPTNPDPVFVIVVSIIIGLLSGFLFVFLRSGIWRANRRTEP
jgi:uncharacterized protein involved in exopolysaccharide biosynthesis